MRVEELRAVSGLGMLISLVPVFVLILVSVSYNYNVPAWMIPTIPMWTLNVWASLFFSSAMFWVVALLYSSEVNDVLVKVETYYQKVRNQWKCVR